MSQRRASFAAVASCIILFAGHLAGQQRVLEPLPLDAAASVNEHATRSSFNLSPDGQWVAHTWTTDENALKGATFTAAGVSYGDGPERKQAALNNVKTGETIPLGTAGAFNWAPVWSPDGNRVAYYSDEGGEAGIWIWEKATKKAQRFHGVIARSFFGFEVPRWSSDSQRILCKILPEGTTVAQANALLPNAETVQRFPRTAPGEPSVIVFKSPGDGAKKSAGAPVDMSIREQGDLAILDLRSRRVTRIATGVKPEWWAFSPDQKYVAYTTTLGWEPNSQRPIHQIVVYEVATGQRRILAPKIHLNYGIELSWSPDSRQIGYIEFMRANGELSVVSLATGDVKSLNSPDLPGFSEGEGERPPLWDASGQNEFARGNDGKLWKIEVASGHATAIGNIEGYRIDGIVRRADDPAIWTTDNGSTAWVVAHERNGTKSGIFRIDLASGGAKAVLADDRGYANPVFNVDANQATGEIAYVAEDQQHLADAWVLETATGATHQVTHLNERIEHYSLGEARIIHWMSIDGQKLSGTLLLPPSYRAGQRVPLVVWIYGGRNGSTDVNRFGLWGDMPLFNFHVLATRGYAVLEPDAPLRAGRQMRDLLATVIPGVDAAIEQGYADPDRLAVMGQSYGSYCTLALISQTTRFKAAVITGAVVHPDLIADYLNTEPDVGNFHSGYYEQGQGKMAGTPWDQRQNYLDNSPVFLFDRIETPLLIGEGDKDSFGHNQLPSDATFAALLRLGKTVEYRIYKDEGHVLSAKPNVIDFWQRRLEFLAEHMNLATNAQGAILFDGDHAKPAKAE